MSTSGDTRVSQLRLASARRRVAAFLEQIEHLEASSFPHPDGSAALAEIKDNVQISARSLDRLDGLDDDLIDGSCIQTALLLSSYTTVLGFILRSTNVRNAFELHFPLKRLVKTVIGEHAKLLMSAEWDFVPFTYPMTLDLLPNFVLVGGPAPESNNVLLIPLAGHEIGHSVWHARNFGASMSAALAIEIEAVLKADPAATKELLDNMKRASYGESDLRQACLDFGSRQLEEIFCDLFGLYVFGASYVYAFDYFLAPGGDERSRYYPSDLERLRFLKEGVDELGIEVEAAVYERWKDSSPTPGVVTDILKVTDAAVARMTPKLRELTFSLLTALGVPLNDKEVVARVSASFERGDPDGSGATLSEIVTAGWSILRTKGGLANAADRAEYKLLGELMLKSVEVSEFLLRVEQDA